MPSSFGIRCDSKSAATVIESVSASPIVMLPPNVRLPVISVSPVTTSVVPSNVKLALSSSSPSVPASNTLPDVKSLTVKLGATTSLSISIMPVPAASNSKFALES